MIERIETSSGEFELFPTGQGYLWTIEKPVTKEKSASGNIFYKFKLSTPMSGKMRKFTYVCMVFKAGDILRALGIPEVKKNVFEWDRDLVVGAQFLADVVHEPDYKDRNLPKEQQKIRAALKNLRSIHASPVDEPPPEVEGDMMEEGLPF